VLPANEVERRILCRLSEEHCPTYAIPVGWETMMDLNPENFGQPISEKG
jgi:formate hydrogenlyase subunit 6/NADH:ubiquinone oxidoreductase subunit I